MPHQSRGRAWTVRDRYGDVVYLTWERWEHILEFHPEMEPFFDDVRRTIQSARRRQAHLAPHKWFYTRWGLPGLEPWNNCLVVVVIHRAEGGRFVVTAYQDYIKER